MTIIPYVIYLIIIALHAVILQGITSIYTASLNLPAFIVLAVGLYKEDIPATWFGFAAGLVAFAGAPPTQLGWHGLIMAGLALGARRVRERLNLESLKARLLVVFGGLVIHNVIVLLISQADAFLINLLRYALAGAVYTSLIAWLFFLVKERVITVEKVKAIF
ncbi:MAG: hypothetical protein AB1772_10920 [Candidatus Zixiibacteriota bacterium]